MTWTFLSVEAVLALHTAQIEEFGGSPGLRDPGLLDLPFYAPSTKRNTSPMQARVQSLLRSPLD